MNEDQIKQLIKEAMDKFREELKTTLEDFRKSLPKLKLSQEQLDSVKGLAEEQVTKLAEQVKKLADNQTEIGTKLNTAFDEIRSIGGERLPKVKKEPSENISESVSTIFDLD